MEETEDPARATIGPRGRRQASSTGVCVVLGMHRSGTSAVTAAAARLGLTLPVSWDLMTERVGNPLGHFESKSLSDFNDRLLGLLGGRWDRPPLLSPGWELDPILDPVRSEAAERFEVAFPRGGQPAIWKDPRLSLLLPFWRRVIDRDLVGVFPTRPPLEIALSLQARDGLRMARSFSLYVRYVQLALEALAGMAVYVCSFDELIAAPSDLVDRLGRFLERTGLPVARADDDEVNRLVRPELRHLWLEDRAGVSKQIAHHASVLERTLSSLAGGHEQLVTPTLASEPDDVAEELASRLDPTEQRARVVLMARRWRLPVLRPA